MEGTFWLHWYADGVSHFARVTLVLVEQAQNDVALAPEAFDWLYDVHGPNASVSPYHFEFGPDAVAGVLFGLRQVGAHAQVVISKVEVNNLDTSPNDVRFAAAQAVWQLLGRRPEVEPQLGDSLRLGSGSPLSPDPDPLDGSRLKRQHAQLHRALTARTATDQRTAVLRLVRVALDENGLSSAEASKAGLVERLDEQAWDLKDQVERGEAAQDEYLSAFRRARAASAWQALMDPVALDDAAYEAVHALPPGLDALSIISR